MITPLRASRLCALALVFLAVVAGACSGSTSGRDDEARRVIVDTDMGVDDVRALMLLLEHPDVEVIAVSVTGTGLGRCPESAHNAVALLAAMEAKDIPVGCGTTAPIEGFNTFPTDWRDGAVALPGMDLDVPEGGDTGDEVADAVQVMSDALASSDDPITLLTLGPLTNVAPLLETDPNLDKIDDIRIMGGAVDVGGNIISFSNFVAEFNIWIDPVAADRVFRSDMPMTLIPLDATNDVPLTPGFVAALESAPTTSATSKLAANLAAGGPVSGLYHWDDLAAATLINEDVAEFETISVAVDTDLSGPETGRTLRASSGASMRVAVGADRTEFEQLFFETMTGTAMTTTELWVPASVITFDGDSCSYTGPDPLGSEISAKIENTSGEPGLGVVFGTYAEGATADDIQTMVDGGFSAPPAFFNIHTLASLPANTAGYVSTKDIPPHTTVWCAVNDDVVELAGPKLRSP